MTGAQPIYARFGFRCAADSDRRPLAEPGFVHLCLVLELTAGLGAGRCLVRPGRGAEARHALCHARRLLASVGARPALDETDGLPAQTGSSGP